MVIILNSILELKGKKFTQQDKENPKVNISMQNNIIITSNYIEKLIDQLKKIKDFWMNVDKLFDGILLTVFYNKIVAKSNRISGLLKKEKSNDYVVGAKFNKDKNKHIITYFLTIKDLDYSIDELNNTRSILKEYFNDKMDKQKLNDKKIVNKEKFHSLNMSMSLFKKIISDVSYIEKFDVYNINFQTKKSIITLYDVKKDAKSIFENIGIDLLSSRIIDNQTVYLEEKEVEILYKKAPYLVAMATVDMTSLSPDDFIDKFEDE